MRGWPKIIFSRLYKTASRNGVYKPAQFQGSGYRIVNMGEMFAFDRISSQEMKRIQLSDEELERSRLEDGDLLFGRRSLVESGAGKCSVVITPPEPLTFESSIIRVRLDSARANPRFYFYYFASPQGRGLVRSIVTGTNVKGIRGSVLSQLAVDHPPLATQQRIAELLQLYDDLIENNTRRIALLEQAARLLYEEWFVRLRFPGREHTCLTAGVPAGWRRATFGDLCEEIREQVTPDELSPDTPYIGLEHIPRRSITLADWDRVEQVTSTKHRFRAGEIIFGKIRPYFHKVGFALIDGVASSDAIVIRPRAKDYHALVLMTASSDLFVRMVSQTVREGSKMPRADWKVMQQYPVLVPPPRINEVFSDVVRPMMEQLRVLALQRRKAREARDLLLPRLMSGEVAV